MSYQLNLWNWSDRSSELDTPQMQTFALPDAEVDLYERFWDQEMSDRYLAQLFAETNWQQETAHLFDQHIPLPRLTAWYGDTGKAYTYSGIEMQPTPWTATLLELKSAVETVVAVRFNSVLLNLYRNGSDRVGWHSDAEPTLGKNPVIASVSFGATRRFSLKHKHRADLKLVHLDLSHGSLLLMQGSTQHHWVHQVPKTTKLVDARINLTFRLIQ